MKRKKGEKDKRIRKWKSEIEKRKVVNLATNPHTYYNNQNNQPELQYILQ